MFLGSGSLSAASTMSSTLPYSHLVGYTHRREAVSVALVGYTHRREAVSVALMGYTHRREAVSVALAGYTHRREAVSVALVDIHTGEKL